MATTLLLFDVDGTLMITRGAGSRCILRACRKLFGEQFEWGSVLAGRLDPQIFADLAGHNRIERPQQHHDAYRDLYLSELEAELACIGDDIVVLPGIAALLDQLHERAQARGDVVLGLLTGNYGRAVELKLNAAGIDLDRFPVRAFAEDGRTRADLVRVAMSRAASITGRPVPPSHVIVIGDTPRDIECARAHGCRAVSVATGRYTEDDLRRAGADLVLADLSDPAPLLAMIDAETSG